MTMFLREASLPDGVCGGCNKWFSDLPGIKAFFMYYSRVNLQRNQPYDIYCEPCATRMFRKAIRV